MIVVSFFVRKSYKRGGATMEDIIRMLALIIIYIVINNGKD